MKHNIAYYPSLLARKTAVTLVAHGLNLKPEAMLPLINWLAGQGSDVYLVKLSGHHPSTSITEVQPSTWQQEMLSGCELATKASLDNGVPLFFLGYSLGALLGQSVAAKYPERVKFHRQVLIAPAFAMRQRSILIRLLFLFGKQRKVPSFSPKEYRVNKSLPLLIYDILFREEEIVLASRFKNLNTPTLVVVDPKDELISYPRLSRQVKEFGLTNYRLLVLEHDLANRSGGYHHLIIDEPTMGKRNWEKVTSEMRQLLFAPLA